MITTCAKQAHLAMSTKAKAEKVLDTTDKSYLRASFRQALSFSIPPLTLYRNDRHGGYSHLIFGVPLVDHATSEGNVPKVMTMCMEEIEKRGLNINGLYSDVSRDLDGTSVLELRRRFESGESFSFNSTDNIIFVSILLQRYLWDLPEPLLVLSLQEYRDYKHNRARNTENDFSLLRSKIRKLPPVHRETLGALLRHLLRVTSHSDKAEKRWLANVFSYAVLRGSHVLTDGIRLKIPVMEDLIQNVHTLFDESPSQPPSVPLSNVEETISANAHGSLFLNPLPQSTTQHHSEFVDGIPTTSQLSFSLPSDATTNSRHTPSPITFLSPILGLSSSRTLTEGLETTMQEQVIPKGGARAAAETLPNSIPPDAEYIPAPMSVAEWRLRQSRLTPDPEAGIIPRSPPESVLSSASDFPLSSATSLQTRSWGFSP